MMSSMSKKFEVDFRKRLQQQSQARRKNLGLPEPDPRYKKYIREKPFENIKGYHIYHSRPRIPEYESKMMSDKEYLLSCIKNQGWRLIND